jgi:hypothetical protein
LGKLYHKGGFLKKAKFHFEAAAMVGHTLDALRQMETWNEL